MHNFGNIGNNLERLAYKHVLEYSIQNYDHCSECAKSITWEIFPHIWSGPTADIHQFKNCEGFSERIQFGYSWETHNSNFAPTFEHTIVGRTTTLVKDTL